MATSTATRSIASPKVVIGITAWLGSIYGAVSLLHVPMPRLDFLCGKWG